MYVHFKDKCIMAYKWKFAGLNIKGFWEVRSFSEIFGFRKVRGSNPGDSFTCS